jgi:hypothetical protein
VKALSGRQPWWYWLLHGKGIENRWPTSSAHVQMKAYRGPILLHASAGFGPRREFHEACVSIRHVADELTWAAFRDEHLDIVMLVNGEAQFRPRATILRGGIIGRACVAGLITPEGHPYREEGRLAIERLKPDMRWHAPGQWGHILADVEPLPFVPWKGALGLFDVPESVISPTSRTE